MTASAESNPSVIKTTAKPITGESSTCLDIRKVTYFDSDHITTGYVETDQGYVLFRTEKNYCKPSLTTVSTIRNGEKIERTFPERCWWDDQLVEVAKAFVNELDLDSDCDQLTTPRVVLERMANSASSAEDSYDLMDNINEMSDRELVDFILMQEEEVF